MNIGATRGASGEYGGVVKTVGTATGVFQGFLAVTDCQMTLSACIGNVITAGIGDTTIKAGTYVPGAWTSITSTAGTFIAYNRRS